MSVKFTDNSGKVLASLERAERNGLVAIGMTAERYAKHTITDYSAVDTGRLRNSITYAISGEEAAVDSYSDNVGNNYQYEGKAPDDTKKAVYIGTNVEYGPYVELGTSRMAARPFLRPAATEHGEEYKGIMEAAMKSADG